jgi:hypothetical protein
MVRPRRPHLPQGRSRHAGLDIAGVIAGHSAVIIAIVSVTRAW